GPTARLCDLVDTGDIRNLLTEEDVSGNTGNHGDLRHSQDPEVCALRQHGQGRIESCPAEGGQSQSPARRVVGVGAEDRGATRKSEPGTIPAIVQLEQVVDIHGDPEGLVRAVPELDQTNLDLNLIGCNIKPFNQVDRPIDIGESRTADDNLFGGNVTF